MAVITIELTTTTTATDRECVFYNAPSHCEPVFQLNPITYYLKMDFFFFWLKGATNNCFFLSRTKIVISAFFSFCFHSKADAKLAPIIINLTLLFFTHFKKTEKNALSLFLRALGLIRSDTYYLFIFFFT